MRRPRQRQDATQACKQSGSWLTLHGGEGGALAADHQRQNRHAAVEADEEGEEQREVGHDSDAPKAMKPSPTKTAAIKAQAAGTNTAALKCSIQVL